MLPEIQEINEVSLKMTLYKAQRELPQGDTGKVSLVDSLSREDGAGSLMEMKKAGVHRSENWRGDRCSEKEL